MVRTQISNPCCSEFGRSVFLLKIVSLYVNPLFIRLRILARVFLIRGCTRAPGLWRQSTIKSCYFLFSSVPAVCIPSVLENPTVLWEEINAKLET